jgi:hypothetical protein
VKMSMASIMEKTLDIRRRSHGKDWTQAGRENGDLWKST